jgi:hypothetical protein
MTVLDFPYTVHDAWKRAEAERKTVQRIGRYPVLELADPPRNPDGCQSEWCALLDAKPKDAR